MNTAPQQNPRPVDTDLLRSGRPVAADDRADAPFWWSAEPKGRRDVPRVRLGERLERASARFRSVKRHGFSAVPILPGKHKCHR